MASRAPAVPLAAPFPVRPVSLGFVGPKLRRPALLKEAPPPQGPAAADDDDPDRDSAYLCKIGGLPTDWNGAVIPELTGVRCPSCGRPAVLLCQLYSPAATLDDPEFELERSLILLGCNYSSSCQFFRCVRLQMVQPVFAGQPGNDPGSAGASATASPQKPQATLDIDECFGGGGGGAEPSGHSDGGGLSDLASLFGGLAAANDWDSGDAWGGPPGPDRAPATTGSAALPSLDSLLAAHEDSFGSPVSGPSPAPASRPPSPPLPKSKPAAAAGGLPRGTIKPFFLEWEEEPTGLSASQLSEQEHAERLLRAYQAEEEARKQRSQQSQPQSPSHQPLKQGGGGGAAAAAAEERWEEEDSGDSEDDSDDEERMGTRRRRRRGRTGRGGGRQPDDEEDERVRQFQERLRRAPDQILRFQPGGRPLYVGRTARYRGATLAAAGLGGNGEVGAKAAEEPDLEPPEQKNGAGDVGDDDNDGGGDDDDDPLERCCAACGQPLQLEFQLMPYFLTAANVRALAATAYSGSASPRRPRPAAADPGEEPPEAGGRKPTGMDWTTVDVYTCSGCCTGGPQPEAAGSRGYFLVDEVVHVQAPLL